MTKICVQTDVLPIRVFNEVTKLTETRTIKEQLLSYEVGI